MILLNLFKKEEKKEDIKIPDPVYCKDCKFLQRGDVPNLKCLNPKNFNNVDLEGFEIKFSLGVPEIKNQNNDCQYFSKRASEIL